MRPVQLQLLATALAVSTACTPSMGESWDGELDCGPGTVDIGMWVEFINDDSASANEYSGYGLIYWTTDNTYQLSFDVEITRKSRSGGEFDLDVELDNCRDENHFGEVRCSDAEATWAPKSDLIEGTVEEFAFAGGDDCDFELEWDGEDRTP